MTHDELLAKVDDITFKLDNGTYADTHKLLFQSNALRAVVELHKPMGHYILDDYCEKCSRVASDIYVLYPCDTILAIEKELR